MKRTLIIAGLALCLLSASYGFVFTDTSALAQRSAHLASHMGQWANNLGKFTQQIALIQGYVNKFQEYYGTFSNYKAKIEDVYRKIRNRDWVGLITTATELYAQYFKNKALAPKDPGSFDYPNLDNFDLLKDNEAYRSNPRYREYVDALIDRDGKYRENIFKIAEQIKAIRQVQESRLDRLAEFEKTNKDMSYEGDENASVTEQLALLNQVMIEQAKQQHETESMMRQIYELSLQDKLEDLEKLGLQRRLETGRYAEQQQLIDRLMRGGTTSPRSGR